MNKYLVVAAVSLVSLVPASAPEAKGDKPLVLENARLLII